MHEHIARSLYYLEVHLLYSSIVCCAAWVLTSSRRGSATAKYWIWVATALNFIPPIGAVLDKVWASHLSRATPLGFIGEAANNISQGPFLEVLGVVWLLGTTSMLTRLCLRVRADHRHSQAKAGQGALNPRQSLLAHGVPVSFAESRQAPAVEGVLHPHISLPNGIDRLLSERELNAVLMHELKHASRRDNLIRLIYEVGLCGLWFHPQRCGADT
jgi:beta-lactamase regulating signal transducer with metallopeptidase domain